MASCVVAAKTHNQVAERVANSGFYNGEALHSVGIVAIHTRAQAES